MKLSFSTLGCPEFEWDDILSIASDMGYNGVEIRGVGSEIYVPAIKMFSEPEAAATKDRLSSLGLSIPCFTSGCELHIKEQKEKTIKEGKEYIDAGARMGVPYVRVLADSGPAPDGSIDEALVRDTAAELGAYASSRGVEVLIESNGWFADSERLAKMIQSVGGGVAALWDIHHPYRFFSEPPKATYDNLKQYIRHTHFKDSKISDGNVRYALSGEGDVPAAEFVELLESGGYQGFMSLEWVRRWDLTLEEPGIAFAQYVNYMRDMLS
ncbi:MAG: sugar phosphate isomerase/epimerase family protein [Christensenellales bacterium]|jgi:sugar phosphate isomerase/epimerase